MYMYIFMLNLIFFYLFILKSIEYIGILIILETFRVY